MTTSFLLFSFITLLLVIPISTTLICPDGFTLLLDNKCVQTFRNTTSHMSAEDACRNYGGTLVNLKSAIDNRAVSTFALSSGIEAVWIGVYCFNNGALCFNDDGSLVQSGFMSINMMKLDSINDGNCVYMDTKSGKWRNAACTKDQYQFVCEVPVSYSDSTNCPHNFNGYCYFPSHEISDDNLQKASYSDASDICRNQYNAQLVSLHSMRESDYVKNLLLPSIWVRQVYIGAQAFLPDTFEWADGSSWDFVRMNPISDSSGDCLIVDGQSSFFLWSESGCSDRQYFVCKRRASDAPTAPSVQQVEKVITSQSDDSKCNSPDILMSPSIVTSNGYPSNNPASVCTWQFGAIGAYHGAVFFPTGSSTDGPIWFYNEDGYYERRQITGWSYISYSPTNLIKMVYSSRGVLGSGFKATFMAV